MSKRKIIPILILIIFLIIGGIVYFFVKPKVAKKPSPPIPVKEKTLEEILKDLTAPAGETPEVSEGTIESLTAPGGGEVSEDILKNLTPLNKN